MTSEGNVNGWGGVKNEQAPVNLGWILKITGDWTKGEQMSEMHEKRQPASKMKVKRRFTKGRV